MSLRFPLLLLLPLAAVGCGAARDPVSPATAESASEPHTFLLSSASDPRLPRLSGVAAAVEAGGGGPRRDPASAWSELTGSLGRGAALPPPLMARAYALVHVGIYDALVADRASRRLRDEVVAAGAASRVLNYLFPSAQAQIEALAVEQIGSPIQDLTGLRREAWTLGAAVGDLAVEYGQTDGHDAPFTGVAPSGDCVWTGTNPVLPMCGSWKTWVVATNEVAPEPPYPCGSAEDQADVAEVLEVSLHRTPEQIAVVHKWADMSPPSIWNTILREQVARAHLSPFLSARAFAFLNVAMEDGFIACWSCKYAFWTSRPFQRIPGLVTVIPTPNFPSYTSGHSTISAAAAAVLGEIFRGRAESFRAQAEEAAMSRLWGGIHFRHDNEQGLSIGARIGAKVADLLRRQPQPIETAPAAIAER